MTQEAGIALGILKLGTRLEVCVQLHSTATLLQKKELPAPTAYEAGRAPELVWTLWKKIILCPYQKSKP